MDKWVLGKVVSKWEQDLKAKFTKEMKETFLHAWEDQLLYIDDKSLNQMSQWLDLCVCVSSAAAHHVLCTNYAHVAFFF